MARGKNNAKRWQKARRVRKAKNARKKAKQARATHSHYCESAFLRTISAKFEECNVSDLGSAISTLHKLFPKEEFIVKQPSPKDCGGNLIIITYKEHSKNWTFLGRKCRGCVLHYSDTEKLTLVKSLLPRGAELLTGVHVTKSTESMSYDRISHLDVVQQKLIGCLSDNSNMLNGTLVGKADGSLSGFGILPNSGPVDPHVDSCPFASEVRRQAYKIGLPLFVLNSKGTIILPEQMWSWTVTAIICNFGGMSFASLQSLIKKDNLAPLDALQLRKKPESEYTILQELMLKLMQLRQDVANEHPHEGIVEDESTTYFSFETVCPARTCAWGTKHTELAIAYPESVLRFLGMTYGIGENEEQYRPAYQFSDIVDRHGFNQPCFWHFKDVEKVHSMIQNLDKVTDGSMTLADFLDLHPVDGGATDWLDLEGFILHVPIKVDGTSTSIINCDASTWFGSVEYDKIKTNLYYIAHKLRPQNIGKLLSLPVSTHQYLPIVAALYRIVHSTSNNLAQIIASINLDIANHDVEDSIGNILHETLPEKAKTPFNRMPANVQRKILINQGDKLVWWEYLIKLFARYGFNINVTDSSKKSVGQLLTNIISSPKLVELGNDTVALEKCIKTEFLHIKDGSIVNYREIPPCFLSFIELLMNE
tara:strand:+ start:2165 stop:4111 length:1947 start_codon:yes stop_codon:yes gene_type:complete